jgi:hypothetical protein
MARRPTRQELEQRLTELRERLQTCESRIRLAQQALQGLRQRIMTLAITVPISEMAEVLEQLARIENVLAGREVRP